MKIRVSFFLLLVSLLYSLNFKQVAYIPCGIIWSSGYIKGFDLNRDGYQDLIFHGDLDPGVPDSLPVIFYSCYPWNIYQLCDSISKAGPFWDVGDLDGDSLYDIVVHCLGDTVAIFEQESLNTYPKKRIWKYGFPPQVYNWQPMYITDLDQDGKKEVLCGDDRFLYVFENTGNNQYQIVYFDSVPRDRGKFSFAVDDFDVDGKTEFIASSDDGSRNVLVYECTGDDQYRFISEESVPWPNNSDAIRLGDLDGDGRKEFLVGGCYAGVRFASLMAIFETIGDNQFEIIYIDSVENRLSPFGFHSDCGDVDSDGKNELVWASISDWMIYTATGNNQFQRIYSQYNGNNGHNCTNIYIYDLNKNGYPEIIESGGNETHMFEIEGVRLHRANGGEVLTPGSQCPLTWEKFIPPDADSFSLFVSFNNGIDYRSIATLANANDTMYLWTVPDSLSDSCKIMIWAYGPPRGGENKPRGTAWDVSDSVFAIRQLAVGEDGRYRIHDAGLKILQNPSSSKNVGIEYSIRKASKVKLVIYNSLGQMQQILVDGRLKPGVFERVLSRDLKSGVYFVNLQVEGKDCTEKLVVVE